MSRARTFFGLFALLLGLWAWFYLQRPEPPARFIRDVAEKADPQEIAEGEWTIHPGRNVGAIRPDSTLDDLIKSYGPDHVQSADIPIGEGETRPGAMVFPDDPSRRLAVTWRDPERQRFPETVRIWGEHSEWHTVQGITLGTRLKELEALNGQPFTLAGFDWDYSGAVYSWEGGELQKRLKRRGGEASLRLGVSEHDPIRNQINDHAWASVSGDRAISSADPVMQTLNPAVYYILITFEAPVGEEHPQP